ncbi:MAG: helix-turn-helix transcriptional regulator [Candidatus Dadabacteria bacterium]|nr:helix-turn-helix transcriptional regulator [Candidatus Dadabacteria bacterium]
MNDLARKLTELRQLRGKTLRAVEAETGISNAYLSQMENGKVEKPRPHVLYRLAEYYGVRYEDLMVAAGYLTRNDEERPEDTELAEIQLMSAGLSDDQKKILKRFIRFLQQSQEED